LAAVLTIAAWFFAIIVIAGLWIDCIGGDPDYGCPTLGRQVTESVVAVATALAFSVVLWRGIRRAKDVR
jgi:hypothetical protein